MEDGAEITVDSVQQFVDGFRNDKLPINKIAAVHKTAKNDYVSTWIFKRSTDNFIRNIEKPRVKEGAVQILSGHYTTTESKNKKERKKETPPSFLNPVSVIPLLLS